MQDKLAENSKKVAIIPNHFWDDVFITEKKRLSLKCKCMLGNPLKNLTILLLGFLKRIAKEALTFFLFFLFFN